MAEILSGQELQFAGEAFGVDADADAALLLLRAAADVDIFAADDEGASGIHSDLANFGGGGDVIVSRTVKDLVAGSGLEFEDLGTRALKGLAEGWQVYRVL